VILYDAATNAETKKAKHHDKGWSAAFSPDGKSVASTHGDGAVKLRDAATLEPRAGFASKGLDATAIAFSRDGKKIVVCTTEPVIFVWDSK
jgi:WD40 repeat protein